MFNQVILVGVLTHDAEIKELDDGRKLSEITLMIKRPFKNGETGEYDYDYMKINLWQALATYLVENTKKDSTIGIKGRLVTKKFETLDGKVYNNLEIIAENIIYISK